MNWQKLRYAVSGLLRRPRQKRTCPSCGSASYQRIDRKGFHELLRCGRCFLLYRWPYETQEEMARFYQRTYKQAGLTTELPGPAALSDLIATGFRASEKDFSHIVDLLETLSVSRGSRVLDFGANWGYGVWQLCQVGFSAIGYELSEPRAAYSTKLTYSSIRQTLRKHSADNWKSCHRMAGSLGLSLMARTHFERRIQLRSVVYGARYTRSCSTRTSSGTPFQVRPRRQERIVAKICRR